MGPTITSDLPRRDFWKDLRPHDAFIGVSVFERRPPMPESTNHSGPPYTCDVIVTVLTVLAGAQDSGRPKAAIAEDRQSLTL